MKRLIVARKVVQGSFLALFIYILWSTTYPLTGAVPADTFFVTDPLIMLLTSLARRLVLPGIAVSLLLVAAGAVIGRFFCGWVCPLGTCIDIAGSFGRKRTLADGRNAKLRRIKYLVLGLLVIFAAAGLQLAWVVDPQVIMARFVSLNLIPTTTLLINGLFSWTIRIFRLYGPVYDLYRSLRMSFLGVKAYYFTHALFIFMLFAGIMYAAWELRRWWCRVLCPLGALYALAARTAFLERRVQPCKACKKCVSDCRMGAIRRDISYVKSECILCMDCVYDCPQQATTFSFVKQRPKPSGNGITRRDFLKLAAVSVVPALGFPAAVRTAGRAKVIRPPAALEEDEFVDRCVRCGNCMKVCITNGLQPAMFESGMTGIWTPRLVPEIGYCEYRCTLCGNVCPTGALPRLTPREKRLTRLGIAKINRSICLPWKEKKTCLVCEEHCPIPNKAIRFKKQDINGTMIARPYIRPELCIGCGICQTKCPTRPERSIKVYPVKVTHADANGKVKKETLARGR
ncbi:MAG: 4Fe-4S binding protein [Candidatus Omnitrophica bacterium]|nr:4Fe-4S binding protein [Candidatus Omnitrophota bacterium]